MIELRACLTLALCVIAACASDEDGSAGSGGSPPTTATDTTTTGGSTGTTTTGGSGGSPTCPEDCGAGDCESGQCDCNPSASLCGEICVDQQEDAENCGACGHSCGGGACAAGRCPSELVALSPEPVRRLAKTDTEIVWAGVTTVYTAPLDGGDPTPLGQVSTVPFNYPEAIAVGAAHVYVVLEDGALVRVPLAGGTAEPFGSGADNARDVAVHAGTVYWSGDLAASTGVLAADETLGAPSLLLTEPFAPSHLSADAAGVVYITTNREVVMADLAGQGRTVIGQYPANAGSPSGLSANADQVFVSMAGSGFDKGGVWAMPRRMGATGSWLGQLNGGYTFVDAVASDAATVCWTNQNQWVYCRDPSGMGWFSVNGGEAGMDVLMHAPFVYFAQSEYGGSSGTVIARVRY